MSKNTAFVAIYVLAVVVSAVVLVTIGSSKSTHVLAQAQARGQHHEYVLGRGQDLSLVCITASEECAELIERAERNPQLRDAFLQAKSRGIGIHPSSWIWLGFSPGRIYDGFVVVNTSASDERIIAFLTN
jgi:hypothetical protein